MIRFFIILFLLLSSFEVNAQYRLKAIHSRLIINIDTNQNNRLIMRLNLHDGIPNDTFYIQQSFKDNPTYLTNRAKGRFYQGILVDSLFIYNNRGQVMEKGFFRNLYSYNGDKHPDRLDTISGYGKYGLMGFRHGKFTYYKSGKNYKNYKIDAEIEYAHGFLQGKNIHFHPDGTISTSDTYFRDTLHGEHLIKYSDGITEEIGYYKMGMKDSLWMSYHTNGQLKDSCFYMDDELYSDGKSYYENGQLATFKPRKNGKLEGDALNYYSDGRPKSKVVFSNNEYNGDYLEWYHNGKLEYKAVYKNGVRIGNSEHFDSSGRKKYLSSFCCGVINGAYIRDSVNVSEIPNIIYSPTILHFPRSLKKKHERLLKKAENSLFELDIMNGKVIRIEFISESPELSNKNKEKILRLLTENTTAPGIFYNNSYYGGTVTFQIEKVHQHTKDWVPIENR